MDSYFQVWGKRAVTVGNHWKVAYLNIHLERVVLLLLRSRERRRALRPSAAEEDEEEEEQESHGYRTETR